MPPLAFPFGYLIISSTFMFYDERRIKMATWSNSNKGVTARNSLCTTTSKKHTMTIHKLSEEYLVWSMVNNKHRTTEAAEKR